VKEFEVFVSEGHKLLKTLNGFKIEDLVEYPADSSDPAIGRIVLLWYNWPDKIPMAFIGLGNYNRHGGFIAPLEECRRI